MRCGSFGGFLPGKPARPARRIQHVGCGQSTLAVAPGNLFDDHCLAARAIDATHRVEEKNQKSPEGDELEFPFRELIVTGSWTMAARADCRGSLARANGDFDALAIGIESGFAIDKTSKAMAAV